MHLDNKVVAASIKLLCSRAHNDIKAFISESVEETCCSTGPVEVSGQVYQHNIFFGKSIKGCLSIFNCFIDIKPELMSPFFVKKTCF